MTVGFPTNTVFWIIVTMFATGISVWRILSLGLNRLSLAPSAQRGWRLGIGLVLAVWLLGRLALAILPPASASTAAQFTLSLSIASLGLLVGLLPLLISPTFRKLIRVIPPTWLIGIHAIRIAGFFFLALTDMKLLPAAFSLPAGYGDMLTGLLALGYVGLLGQKKPYARALAVLLNFVGLADLITAMANGWVFLQPFSLHLAASGSAPSYLNFVLLIPSLGVPLFVLMHLYSLYQLRTAPETQAKQVEPTPAQPITSQAR